MFDEAPAAHIAVEAFQCEEQIVDALAERRLHIASQGPAEASFVEGRLIGREAVPRGRGLGTKGCQQPR